MSTPKSPSIDGSIASDDSSPALPFEGAVPVEELSDNEERGTNKAAASGAASGPSPDIQIALEEFNNTWWMPINDKLLSVLTKQSTQDVLLPTYMNIWCEVMTLRDRLQRFNQGNRAYMMLAAYAKDNDPNNYAPEYPEFMAKEVRKAKKRYVCFRFLWASLSAALDKALAVVDPELGTDHHEMLWELWRVRAWITDLERYKTKLDHHGIYEYEPMPSNIPKEPREGARELPPPPENGIESMDHLWFYDPINPSLQGNNS